MFETFYKKELQKANQKEFRIEKVIKRKGNELYVKWKCRDSCFNSFIDKKKNKIKWAVQIRKYFPKSNPLVGGVKVELDLSAYTTKADLENAKGILM